MQWIVRMEDGSLKGPVGTDVILKMIREGVFTGTEQIARFPDGKWTLISREPQFYETLIEALEGVVKLENRKSQKNMSEETIFMPPPPGSESRPGIKTNPLAPVTPTAPPISAPLPPPVADPLPPEEKKTNAIIELANLSKLEKEQLFRVARIPLLVLAVTALLAVLILMMGGEGASDKINLVAPGKPSAPLPEAEIKKRYATILAHIQRDTFEDYLEAQNKLVTLIEGVPDNLEIRAVLCSVYKELWPFAKQDTVDQKVIASVTQTTRVLDVTSPFGSLCEAVKLMTSGRYREARGSVENILELHDSFTMRPVVYEMKAELLENDKDYQIAIPYYEKAAQDWGAWIKPKVRLGFVLNQVRDYTRAAESFRQALALNPNHKMSRIGMAFVQYYGFRQTENAHSSLTTALNAKGKIPRTVEAEAYLVLAEVQVDMGDKSGALSSAETAFQLNPNNENARQLVLRLGGSDRIKKDEQGQNNELIYLGDQYVRQGDCLSAQAEFKAAFELDPKNGTAAMKAAKCLWQLNQSYEAIEWLNKAMRAEPKMIAAYVLQADYLSQRFDFSSAANALTNAARIAPNNHEVLRGMALLEYRKNNMKAAINYGLRAMKAYDADIETYLILSKANLAMALGITSTMKKEIEIRDTAFRDAVRYATKALEFDATNSDAQITFAKMRASTEGVDSAADYLKELIKKYSFSHEYRVALAEIYKESERWNDSRAIYEQVVETDPRNKKAWLGLGESFRALGFNERSLKCFLQAAVLDPTDGEALFQAGKLYLEASRFDEAFQQFQRVKSINPHFPRSNYYAGKAAFLLGRKEEALRFAREEKRLNPNLADAYLLTAEILASQQAFGECAAEYSQALKMRASGAEIYVKAAQCYRQAGSIDIAETMLTLATERESGYADIYKELGAIFQLKGDNARARQSYRNYLELAPNAADKRDIEARIRALGG